MLLVLEVQSLNQWTTREVPIWYISVPPYFVYFLLYLPKWQLTFQCPLLSYHMSTQSPEMKGMNLYPRAVVGWRGSWMGLNRAKWNSPNSDMHQKSRIGNSLAVLVTQVKNPLAMQETWVRSLGQEDPLERGVATHSSIFAWRIPWTEESGMLQSMIAKIRHN